MSKPIIQLNEESVKSELKELVRNRKNLTFFKLCIDSLAKLCYNNKNIFMKGLRQWQFIISTEL